MKCAYRYVLLAVIGIGCGVCGCGKHDIPPPNPTNPPAAATPNATPSTSITTPPKGDTGTLKIDLKFADPKAMVVIDGNQYLLKELAEPIALSVGEHQVILRIGGQDAAHRTLQIEKDKRQILQLGEPNREVAEWVLRAGGELKIAPNHTPIKNVGELPATGFEVTWIGMSHKPVADSDLEVLQGLTSLKQLGLASNSISDEGLLKIANLPALNYINLESTQVGDVGVKHLQDFPTLATVRLDRTAITDAALKSLQPLKLKGLTLNGTKISDAGINHVREMQTLDMFWADDTQLTDAAIANLAQWPKLRSVCLRNTKVTGAGLAKLKALPLQELWLDHTPLTDADLAQMKELKCIWLGLVDSKITDAGLTHLAGMSRLTNLQLGGNEVTDRGVEQLKGLAELRQLGLNKTAVTDQGLVQLTSLSKLEQLNLQNTAVSEAAIAKFKESLPKCQVHK